MLLICEEHKMYEIREYNEKDKEQVIKLWIDVAVHEHGFEEWKESMAFLDEKEFEKILVAVFENEIVGTMAYKKIDNEIAELKRVYLHPHHRGQGIAKKLYSAILDIIKQSSYKQILVETWENFKSGRKFYEKNNFNLKLKENEKYVFILDLN